MYVLHIYIMHYVCNNSVQAYVCTKQQFVLPVVSIIVTLAVLGSPIW